MKPFELHPEAVEEVSEALRHYRQVASFGIAGALEQRVNAGLDLIHRYPQRCAFWKRTRFQRFVLSRFPYVLFYIEHESKLVFLALAHTSRRPGYWIPRAERP